MHLNTVVINLIKPVETKNHSLLLPAPNDLILLDIFVFLFQFNCATLVNDIIIICHSNVKSFNISFHMKSNSEALGPKFHLYECNPKQLQYLMDVATQKVSQQHENSRYVHVI